VQHARSIRPWITQRERDESDGGGCGCDHERFPPRLDERGDALAVIANRETVREEELPCEQRK